MIFVVTVYRDQDAVTPSESGGVYKGEKEMSQWKENLFTRAHRTVTQVQPPSVWVGQVTYHLCAFSLSGEGQARPLDDQEE